MSELTLCNYCSLKAMRAEAKKEGKYVRVRKSEGKLGGVNVYITPDCTQFYNLQPGKEDHDKYFAAWFMSLPDHCVC